MVMICPLCASEEASEESLECHFLQEHLDGKNELFFKLRLFYFIDIFEIFDFYWNFNLFSEHQPWKCSICSKSRYTKIQLSVHLQAAHKQTNADVKLALFKNLKDAKLWKYFSFNLTKFILIKN